MKCNSSLKLDCKIRSHFISAFLTLSWRRPLWYSNQSIDLWIQVYTSHTTSWGKQITAVRDNFYRILKSFKNFKRFENLFKFKILIWKLAVIFNHFPSTDNSILSLIRTFFWNVTQSTY